MLALLLEAEDRAGGKLGSESRSGFLLERAALGLLDRTGELAELCGKLGIAPIPASPAAEQVLVNRAKAYAAGCEQEFGWLLPYMTSEDTARDSNDDDSIAIVEQLVGVIRHDDAIRADTSE